MTSLKLFKIAETAQIFMKTRATKKEQQDIYDLIYSMVHKVRPYRESDGIKRVAPGFFKYTAKEYILDFEDANDGYITIAKISYC